MASGIVTACETASLKDLGEKIRALANVHTEMIDELCSPETRKHSALKDKDTLSGSPGKRSFSTALSTHSVACALEAQGTLPGSPAEQEVTAVVGTLKVEGKAQGAVADESATAADGSAAAEPGAVETPAMPALARDEGADAAPIRKTRRLRWLPSIGGVADCIRRPLCCLAPRLIASESASTATAIDTPSATMSLSIDVPGLDDSDMGDMGDMGDMDDPPLATPYDPSSAGVTGFLIDLDGTMYDPAGLLPGASAFYHWLVASGTPHVFLSNTGAKNAASVQRKFASPHYRIAGPGHLVPLDHILTASEAQCDYMLDNIPAGSKVLVISGGEGTWRSDLRTRGGAWGEQLLDTWELRSYIDETTAKEWAAEYAMSRGSGAKKTTLWVCFFTDGEVGGSEATESAVLSAGHFNDWGFDVIKIAGFLLSHGAQFVYTAEDAYNPSVDPRHPGLVFPLPGPGMFAAMMKVLMYPHGQSQIACAGKGGNQGGRYMMEQARQMLIAQGHSGDPRQIVMVGDRFDTDVRAGLSAGFLTCLVTSGCHSVAMQDHYRTDPVHFYASGVGDLVPVAERAVAHVEALSLASEEGAAGVAGALMAERCAERVPQRMSREASAQRLQSWVLGQSNLLQPLTPTTRQRREAELRPILQGYFDALDMDGDGTMSEAQVLDACRAFGMVHLLNQPAARSSSSSSDVGDSGCGDRAVGAGAKNQPHSQHYSLLTALRTESSKSADGKMNFEQFASVIEEALAECGFEARKQWKKIGNSFKMSRALVRAQSKLNQASDDALPVPSPTAPW